MRVVTRQREPHAGVRDCLPRWPSFSPSAAVARALARHSFARSDLEGGLVLGLEVVEDAGARRAAGRRRTAAPPAHVRHRRVRGVLKENQRTGMRWPHSRS